MCNLHIINLFVVWGILIFLVGGCTNHNSEVFPLTETLDLSVKENAKPLKAEIVQASYDFIHAKDFFVYQDSIMIVLNKPSTEVRFVEFYNLNTNTRINGFISKGNGPGEMLNTLAHIRGNLLFVHDFVKNQIVRINIDSVLQNPDYRLEPLIQFSNNIGSPFVTFYRDDKLIMQNPFYFQDKELSIDNKTPRFITEDNDSVSLQFDESFYYTYNVSQGLIIPNPVKNRLIYVSSFLNELAIYDMDLKPIKMITGPDNLKPTYRLDPGNQIAFDKMVPYSYMGFWTDENSIYFSYIGDFFFRNKRLKDFSSWIFRFDWDGNLIESFYSPEYIKSLSKSSDDCMFYGRGFDQDGMTVLWKLSPVE